MGNSRKYSEAVKLLREINPDLAAVADYSKREMVYAALTKRGYTWDSYMMEWQKKGKSR